MSKGLRISPLVGIFLSLTWVAFFISFAFLSGAALTLLEASLPEICMVVAGFCLPLALIRSFTAVRTAPDGQGLTATQFDQLSQQIQALKRVTLLPENTDSHIKSITKAFKSETTEFQEACDRLAASLEAMAGEIDTQKSKIDMLNASVAKQSDQVVASLVKQSDTIEENHSKAKALANDLESITGKSKEATAEVIERLADPIRLVEDRIRRSTESMAELIRELETQLDETAEGFSAAQNLSTHTREHIAQTTHELQAVVTHTNSELERLGRALPQQIDKIEQLGRVASGKVEELDERFTRHLNAVVETGNAMGRRSEQLHGLFQQHAGQLEHLGKLVHQLSGTTAQELTAQMRGLVGEARNAAQALAQSSQSAHGMLGAVFDRQNELAGQMMHELNGRLERMTQRVRGGFEQAEYDTQRIEGALAGLAERIANMIYGAAGEMTQELEQRLGSLRGEADHVAASLALSTREAVAEMDIRLQGLDSRRQELDAKLAAIAEESSGVIEGHLGEVIGMIMEKMAIIGSDMQSLRASLLEADHMNQQALDQAAQTWYNKMRKSAEQVMGAAELALGDFEAEVEHALKRVHTAVQRQADLASKQSENLADQAAERVTAKIMGLYDTLDERARVTEESIARTHQGMTESVGQVADDMRAMLESFALDMSEASESTVAKLIAQGRELPTIAERMAEAARDALSQLGQTNEGFGQHRQAIRMMVRELEEMAGRIEHRAAALDSKIDDIGGAMEQQSGAVQDHLEGLRAMLQEFQAAGSELTTAIEQRVVALADSTEKTGSVVGSVEQRLNALAQLATDRMQQAQKWAHDVTNEAEDDLLKLDNLSRETFERWSQTRETMGASLSEVYAQVHDLQGTLESMAAIADQQSAKLSAQSAEAQERAQRLIEALNEGQKTAFLRTASDLVAKLQDAAIDVDTILQGELPNDVLRAINSGDRSVSVRRLLRLKGDGGDAAIGRLYAQDSSFRRRLDEFMSGCERLLKLALEADSSRLMHTTVLTADVGKLYLFLREALNHRQAA